MNKYALFGTGAAVLICGLPYHMDTTHYIISTRKLQESKKIAILADLHCRRFGRGQSAILDVLRKERPDLILIPGDLFDTDRNLEISFELIEGLHEFPVYFTSGNHDMYLKNEIEDLRMRLRKEGVHVLENAETTLCIGKDTIELYGLSDEGRIPKTSPEEISRQFKTNHYRILISHRPEFVEFYGKLDCDLIVSGHAHGGQWRLPGTHQGLYAPHMGLLPKYTEGVHDLNGRKLVISRGLASGNPLIPRLYNNPEIVLIDLQPNK